MVSNIPDDMANPDSISNLFGHYGDVMKVKILHNKKDCALIQMSKPHQAALCRQFLDQQKIDNNTLCVSFSRINGMFFFLTFVYHFVNLLPKEVMFIIIVCINSILFMNCQTLIRD